MLNRNDIEHMPSPLIPLSLIIVHLDSQPEDYITSTGHLILKRPIQSTTYFLGRPPHQASPIGESRRITRGQLLAFRHLPKPNLNCT